MKPHIAMIRTYSGLEWAVWDSKESKDEGEYPKCVLKQEKKSVVDAYKCYECYFS